MRHPPATADELGSAAWGALGTSVVVRVTDLAALARARAAVEGELAAIDRACSRFRADSELSRANARAGRWVQVDELLLDALELALRAAALTGGDVDPTLGRALELAGYDRDWELLPAPCGEPEAHRLQLTARPRSAWQAIEIDRTSRSLRIPASIKLDLGATAKAWAADRAAAAAAGAARCGTLVGIGGDIATAGPAPAGGWLIHVTDDHRSDARAPGQTVSICSGGLATSSMAVRRWSHEGHTMHHLIDPATGAPASGPWRTVSVAAADCADANIAATAALVRGAGATSWLAGHGLPARLVDWQEGVLAIAGWPAQAVPPTGTPRPTGTPAPTGTPSPDLPAERRDSAGSRGRTLAA
jgi:FAD:protein FMN transferase